MVTLNMALGFTMHDTLLLANTSAGAAASPHILCTPSLHVTQPAEETLCLWHV